MTTIMLSLTSIKVVAEILDYGTDDPIIGSKGPLKVDSTHGFFRMGFLNSFTLEDGFI